MNGQLDRRGFLADAGAGMAAGTLVSDMARSVAAASKDGASPGQPPNILWICTDQQRYDTITCLGNSHIRTPNIDRLAASGVTFTHAHCQSPICTPSRASFLTGMWPDTIHACINGNDRWDDAAPLITKTLAEAGYDCGLAGKLHLSAAQGRIEKRPHDGYRVFHWSHHPSDDWPRGHAYRDWLQIQGQDYTTLYKKHKAIPAEFHQTTWCARMAADFIGQDRKGPWLFSLNCFDPHPPLDPPREYLERFDVDSLPGPLFRESDLEAQARLAEINFQSKATSPEKFNAKLDQAKYWAQIELIDENLGRLLKVLDQTGQRDNTMIIFTSDHGETLGDHGLRRKGCRFYESLVRVPLIFSWPAAFEQGLISDALVELTDIVPTLLEANGMPVPESMHGKSLMPILRGESQPHHHRDFVRSTYYRTLQGTPSYASMVRTRHHKLINYHGHRLGELFDLERDPGEFDNLWDDPAHGEVRFELMTTNFDAMASAIDIGSERVGRY